MQRRGWGSPRPHPHPSPPAAAASGESSPAFTGSPSSVHMFDLSPELHLHGGLGPLAAAHAAYGVADDDSGSEDGSDDLSAFLQNLKEKYGLADGAAAPPAPAPAPPPAPAAAPDAAPPSVQIRVCVTHSSTTGGGELPPPLDAGPPQGSPSKLQAVGGQAADCEPLMLPQPGHGPAPTAQQPEELQQQGGAAEALAPQAGELDAELDAELSVLEELQRQMAAQQQDEEPARAGSRQQPVAPAQQPPAPPPQQPGMAAAAAAASLIGAAARPAGEAVEQHSSTITEDAAVEPAEAAGPAPLLQHLPWASLHELLVERGFPGVLPAGEADMGAASGDSRQAVQPNPAALFTALHSLLREQARAAAHQQRLAEAAQAAARREGALVSSLTAAAKQRDGEIAKWKRLALDNQRAARDAQQAGGSLSQSREQLAAEARQLQGTVARLQAALHRKVCPLRAHGVVMALAEPSAPCACCSNAVHGQQRACATCCRWRAAQ